MYVSFSLVDIHGSVLADTSTSSTPLEGRGSEVGATLEGGSLVVSSSGSRDST